MADEGVRIKIDLLDVENYLPWSQKMKFLLISKDLWEGVEAPASNAAKSRKALAIIGLHVKDHHLGTIAACKTAGEAWELLEKTYRSKTNDRKLQLRKEMSALKMEPNEVVATYVARAQDLYRDLVATGFQMTSEELAWNVLAGLPASFDTLVTVLETQEEELQVEKMLPKLMVHEQKHFTRENEALDKEGNALAFTARNAGYGRQNFQKQGNFGQKQEQRRGHQVVCYECGQEGHVAKFCEQRKAREEARQCYKCGEKGHIARDCSGDSGKSSARAFTVLHF